MATEVTDVVCHTQAHPASQHQWRLNAEGKRQLANDLIGKPVRLNFKGDPIGHVTAVEIVEGDVVVSLDVVDPQVAGMVKDEKYAIGPALHNPDAPPNIPAGEYEWGPEWKVREVGVVPTEPKPEPKIVGRVEEAPSGAA